jgi:hypothetical protein
MTFGMIGNMSSLTQTAFMAYSHAICPTEEKDSVLRFVHSNCAPFLEPVPGPAGIRASKNAARESAVFYGIFRSIQAGRNKDRKK